MPASDNLHTKITQLESAITSKDQEIENLRSQLAAAQANEAAIISATDRIDGLITSVGNI